MESFDYACTRYEIGGVYSFLEFPYDGWDLDPLEYVAAFLAFHSKGVYLCATVGTYYYLTQV